MTATALAEPAAELREHSPLRARAVVSRMSGDTLIAVLLGAASAVVWLPYALRASLLYDDLSIVSGAVHFPPPFHRDRPLDNVLLFEGIFGTHATVYYAITESIAAVATGALYVCLRRLGLRPAPATIAAATFAVAPLSDSLHLWWAASGIVLSVLIASLAITFGSRWVKDGRPRMRSLVLSEVCVAGSVLAFEQAALLVLLPIALISLSPNRRRTLLKLAIDIPVLLVAGIITVPAAISNHSGGPSSPHNPGRMLQLTRDGFATYRDYILQLGGWRLSFAGAAATAVVGAAWYLRRTRHVAGWGSLWANACALMALLALMPVAWAPLVLTDSYYGPGLLGVGNRVNAVGDVFFAAAIGTAAYLVGGVVARVGHVPIVGVLLTAGFGGGVIGSNVDRSLHDASVYVQAGQRATDIEALVHTLVPKPRGGDFFLLTNYNIYQGPIWVPVLAAQWDVTGAMRLVYHDDSLVGVPLGNLTCSEAGFDAAGFGTTYERLHVIDVGGRRTVAVNDKAACAALLPDLATRPFPV